MEIIIGCYIALVGLAIGSFLNVLIYRIPLKISAVKGNSYCPNCEHKLNWLDLFPVFSYIFLLGKCRYCKEKISFRYPLVELLNGSCWLIIYLVFGLNINSLLYALVCSCLITLAFIDIDHKIIPDRFHIIIGACGIISVFTNQNLPLLDRVIGLFAVSVPLLLIVIFIGGMGMGDVKLLAVSGFLLGWKLILLTMLVSSVIAAAFGIYLMITKKASRKSEIPFGPYIAFAVIICLLVGNNMISLYLNFLGVK